MTVAEKELVHTNLIRHKSVLLIRFIPFFVL